MDISGLFKQAADERESYIGQTARLGGKVIGHIARTRRQTGDFRNYIKNARENQPTQLF